MFKFGWDLIRIVLDLNIFKEGYGSVVIFELSRYADSLQIYKLSWKFEYNKFPSWIYKISTENNHSNVQKPNDTVVDTSVLDEPVLSGIPPPTSIETCRSD